MRKRAAVLLVLLGVVAAGGANAPAKGGEQEVYGLLTAVRGSALARLDPVTLEPLARTRVQLGRLNGFAYDEWHGYLALDDGYRLRIVGLSQLAPRATLRLGTADPTALAWLSWDTIVVVRRHRVLAVDWMLRKVRTRATFSGDVVAQARGDDELVLLLAPSGSLGPARLLVVRPTGATRIVSLPGIAAGTEWTTDQPPTGKTQVPGLALDAEHGTAYVTSGGAVVEVPLRGTPVSHLLHGRFAKSISGRWESAAWLGNARLAVAGSVSADGTTSTPTGLAVVDTRSWSVVASRPTTSFVVRWGELALTAGVTLDGLGQRQGSAVAAVDRTGAERWTALAGVGSGFQAVTAAHGYVTVDGNRLAVLDLGTGRVLATRDAPLPFVLSLRTHDTG